MWNFKMLLQSTPTPTQRAPPCQAHHISHDAMRKFCFLVNLPPDLTRWYLTLHLAVTRDILITPHTLTPDFSVCVPYSCKLQGPLPKKCSFYILHNSNSNVYFNYF